MHKFDNIQAGMTHERILTVENRHTVSHTNVSILSTPMMISFMERISAEMVHMILPRSFTTVGYEVHIRHKAPARLGAELEVFSELVEIDGRKLLFEVRVSEGERVIGEGLHRRTIVPIAE